VKKIENKYIRIAIIAVISGAVLYAIMSIIDNIGLVYQSIAVAVGYILRLLAPVLTGFVIAFLLSRPSNFFSRILLKIKFFAKRRRLSDITGVLIAFAVFIAIIFMFFYLLVPGVIESVGGISRDLPAYTQSIDAVLNDLSRNNEMRQVFNFIGVDITNLQSISAIISQYWADITIFLKGLAGGLFGFIIDTGLFLYNFVLGLFFAVYMLLFKEQIKGQLRLLSVNVFRKSHYKLMFVIDITDDMFYKFLVGKGICSLVVGILAFAVCTIMGFKYSPLISVIIAVTNMIPTFGPFIGAIPALVLSLMTGPIYVLYMLIIVVGLQMVDAYIVGPRLLGNSMGINGFWIMFSIIVMGSLFGVPGMLAAVPLFGVLRILFKNWIYRKNNGALEGEEEFAASMRRFREWTTKKPKDVHKENKKSPPEGEGKE
jgi:predicted PurR-regulated permease PerM